MPPKHHVSSAEATDGLLWDLTTGWDSGWCMEKLRAIGLIILQGKTLEPVQENDKTIPGCHMPVSVHKYGPLLSQRWHSGPTDGFTLAPPVSNQVDQTFPLCTMSSKEAAFFPQCDLWPSTTWIQSYLPKLFFFPQLWSVSVLTTLPNPAPIH